MLRISPLSSIPLSLYFRRGTVKQSHDFIVLAAAKTFNSDFCHKVTNALY